MSLTAKKIESLKPSERMYRVADERGLCLEVPPSGAKRWRYRYRYNGKAKMLSLGVYPEISLKDARMRLEDCRKQLAHGIDPSEQRKEELAERSGKYTFEYVAREWFGKFTVKWSEGHAETVIERLEKNVFPFIGNTPIKQVTAPELLTIIERIELRGAVEVARRVRGICSQIFRYAMVTGKADQDPAAAIRGAVPPLPKNVKHHAAITEPKKIGSLLRAIDSFDGTIIVHSALRLAPLVFVRPNELRRAEWAEIDLQNSLWQISAEKMKAKRPHVVPLSKQAKEIFEVMLPITGSGKYVFPSMRSEARPMSENTINAALRRLGFSKDEMTCHGFRSMASTNLNSKGWGRDAIERQLAHVEGNSVRAAYNHADYMQERVEMMQWWADHLDLLRERPKPLIL